jgi:hypothetical protein
MSHFKNTLLGTLLGLAGGFIIIGCPNANLNPEEIRHVDKHNTTIEKCKAEGREAGSYAAYQACKDDAGIKDGVSP